MIPRRAFGAVLAALIGLVVLAGPASAHTELESSSPAEGATGRDGTAWQVGTPVVAGAVVTAPVTPSGPAQAYTLTWKVIAKDGDNLTGTVHFSVTAASSPPASASPAPTASAQAQAPSAPTAVDTSGIPGWIWVVVGVVGLLAVIVVGLRQLKGRGKD
jgi:methionine-rich copper-binding protein CopC